jgi:hypothetical protein
MRFGCVSLDHIHMSLAPCDTLSLPIPLSFTSTTNTFYGVDWEQEDQRDKVQKIDVQISCIIRVVCTFT